MIDLLAYRHHMRWLNFRDANLLGDVRNWRDNSRDHIRNFVVAAWRQKLRDESERG